MPIVPTQAPQISSDVNVPGANIQGAGATSEAIARVGSSVAQMGVGILNNVKDMEAQDAASQAYHQRVLDSESEIARMKLTSPDGYIYEPGIGSVPAQIAKNPDGTPRTITQAFRDKANGWFEQDQSAMPSLLAQQIYKQKAETIFTSAISSVYHDEQLLKVQAYEENRKSRLQSSGDNLVSSPSIDKLYQFSNDQSIDLKNQIGVTRSAPIAAGEIRTGNSLLAEQMIQGAYSQVLQNVHPKVPGYDRALAVNNWLAILDGKDIQSKDRSEKGLPTVADMLNPDRKAELRDKFIRLLELAKNQDSKDYSILLQNVRADTRAGKPNKASIDAVVNIGAQLVKDGRKDQLEYAMDMTGLQSDFVTGERAVSPEFVLASHARAMEMIKADEARVRARAQSMVGNTPGLESLGGAVSQPLRDAEIAAAQRINDAKKADWAGFIESNEPSIRGRTAQLDYANASSFFGKRGLVQDILNRSDAYFQDNFPGQSENFRIISKPNSKLLGWKSVV